MALDGILSDLAHFGSSPFVDRVIGLPGLFRAAAGHPDPVIRSMLLLHAVGFAREAGVQPPTPDALTHSPSAVGDLLAPFIFATIARGLRIPIDAVILSVPHGQFPTLADITTSVEKMGFAPRPDATFLLRGPAHRGGGGGRDQPGGAGPGGRGGRGGRQRGRGGKAAAAARA